MDSHRASGDLRNHDRRAGDLIDRVHQGNHVHTDNHRKKDGWTFTCLGAKQDAWAASEFIGIRRRNSANYRADAPDLALRSDAEAHLPLGEEAQGWEGRTVLRRG